MPICLSSDPAAVRVAAQEQVGAYGTFPVYQAMFAPPATLNVGEGFSDELVAALVASGSDDADHRARSRVMREGGAAEVMTHILFIGDDRAAYQDRAFDLLARAQREIG